jgi:hypothetical protein
VIILTTTRRVFVAPTSGRARLTRSAAYREEARARFAALCDCDETGDPRLCRYHDPVGWERTTSGQSRNAYITARWACMLAALDGCFIRPPEPLGKPVPPPSPDDDLPF